MDITRAGAVWAQFERDPRVGASAHLRASDRDRDVARAVLTSAYVDGRLQRAELDERTAVLARTRTLGELVPLLDDLVPTAPAPVVARPPDELRLRAEQHYEVLRGRALAAMLIPSLICAVVWVVGGLGPDGWDPVFPWPLFVLLGTGIAPLRLALRRTEVVAAEQARLERKERRRLEKGERGAQEADPDPDA